MGGFILDRLVRCLYGYFKDVHADHHQRHGGDRNIQVAAGTVIGGKDADFGSRLFFLQIIHIQGVKLPVSVPDATCVQRPQRN